jgi:hypothetical protein
MAVTLKHHWPCDEGTGSTLNDIVGGKHLTPYDGDNDIRWCKSNTLNPLIGMTDRSYIGLHKRGYKKGSRTGKDVLRNVAGIPSVSNPVISFLFRHQILHQGCIMRWKATSGTAVRSWDGTIDTPSGDILAATEYDFATWHHLVLVYNGVGSMKVYLDGVHIKTLGQTLKVEGEMIVNAYDDPAGFLGGVELCDPRVYSWTGSVPSDGLILALYNGYGTKPAKWTNYSPYDLGGFAEFSEYSLGTGIGGTDEITSITQVGTDYTRYNFNGNACGCGRSSAVPNRLKNGEIWGYFEFKLPLNFDVNHDYDDKFVLFMIENTIGFNWLNSATVQAEYTQVVEGTGDITKNRVVIATSANAMNNNYPTLIENIWIPLEYHLDYAAGTLKIWVGGQLVSDLSGQTFNSEDITRVYYGLNDGVHPQNATKFLDYRKLYIGEEQFAEPITGSDNTLTNDGFDQPIYKTDLGFQNRIIRSI